MSKKGSQTNFGVRNKDIWYLQIPDITSIPTRRVKSNKPSNNPTKGKNQIVRRIDQLDGKHPSYCLTEPKTHKCLFNNVITLQCNLQEVFLPNLKNEDEFVEASVLMHRWGKRVSLEKYHHENIDEAVKRNRRIGTGITGCLQSSLFNPNILDRAYAAIQKENKSYSKELGIPESIRTTVVKPSGTMSIWGDCTPGIHPAFSQYGIRRVRFASNDSCLPFLKEAGHPIEPVIKFDGTMDHRTQVVSFYRTFPDGTPCADGGFDTWKQLDAVLMAQKHWSDQSVSVTVYYKKDEIDQIKEWLTKNIKNIKTISFLCHSDHGFNQAPEEAITKDQYEKAIKKIKPIDIDKITEGQLESLECAGGACPIK